MAKILKIGLYLIVALFAAVLVGKFQPLLSSTFKTADTTSATQAHIEISKEYTDISQEYTDTDVSALISIKQVDDILPRRESLTNFLWGKSDLPTALPTSIEENWQDARYKDIQSIFRIDKLIVSMEFGLESTVYHFIPQKSNNKVVLYHQGHLGDFIESKRQIKQLVDHGYTVVAFCMPLLGLNNQPVIESLRIGVLKITNHDQIKFLSPEQGHPIKFFIEPVITVINYLEKDFAYDSISMIGLSGGGWTTTLSAAADIRINYSFPVAGSYPIYLRSGSERDWGDYEQNNPELYKVVNYLELYVLGGFGDNRKQLQVINQYDPCCFAGIKWQTYKDIVSERVQQLGLGEFDLFLDDSHQEHLVSSVAMSRILDELENR